MRNNSRDHNWRDQALCASPLQDPEAWFPAGETGLHAIQAEEAKAVCRRCPVMSTCLNWAMETRQQGVWGGTTDQDRDGIRRRVARRLRNTGATKTAPERSAA